MSVLLEFFGSHLYWSVILHISSAWVFGTEPISIGHYHASSVWVGTTPISIGHSSYRFSLSFEVAPISIGHCLIKLSLGFWGCTYIDWSLFFQFEFVFNSSWDRTYIDRSFFMSVLLEFLRSYLYRSSIVLSIWVWVFGSAPILISHCFVSLILCSVQVGTAPISIGHFSCQFCLSFWDCTYIDRLFV